MSAGQWTAYGKSAAWLVECSDREIWKVQLAEARAGLGVDNHNTVA